MSSQKSIIVALAAFMLLPNFAKADFVLDTGAPAGSSTFVLNTADYYAGEFNDTTGAAITGLSAYLTQGVGQPGDTFTFDIYANSGFTSRPNTRPAPLFTATGTFTTNGWNTTSVNWTPPSTGDYWLALQVSSTTQTKGLDLPGETSLTTGTMPALAFAFAGTSGQYSTSGAPGVGLEITESSPVPLPNSVWLLASGLLGLGLMTRLRRDARP